jgi:hypothetical protein
VVAIFCALALGYQPTLGRSLAVWLVDSRFWGTVVFPADTGDPFGLAIGGFLVIAILVILALLQDLRLTSALSELGPGGQLTVQALFRLLLPLPLVALAMLYTGSMIVNPAATATAVVYEAIRIGRDYDGDLFQLGLERGVNYAAINGVRDRLSGDFTLRDGEIDPEMSMAFVVADFENGAWINCRVMAGQLSFCYDAAPPYSVGLASLLTGEPAPESCRGCMPEVDDQLAQWLRTQGASMGEELQIERTAQWGGYVTMLVTSAANASGIECRFRGMSPVRLESCLVVEP